MFNMKKDINVHFIGIGGIGMSGIAEILISLGYAVSGSDLNLSATVENLKKMGARIEIGHKRGNIKNATVVVYSSAVDQDNPEMLEAKELLIPVMRRAEMLAELMRLKHGIAVAGTHGKTTTTSMLATILQESGLNPTYIIGGIVNNLQGHAKVGAGDLLVAEADESDGSFLLLNPIMSVITNIDNDHLNYYQTADNLDAAFLEFSNKVPFYGCCALNAHDEKLMSMKKLMKKPFTTFGIAEDLHDGADYEARKVSFINNKTEFVLCYEKKEVCSIKLQTAGRHNVLNALGAIVLAHKIGLSFEKIATSLGHFAGVGRRMQTVISTNSIEVIDDYAHHPTEISAVLKATKETRPDAKIIAIFEPHRFTRTRDCWDQFLHCFNIADTLYLCPIYPASEKEITGINSDRLSKDINAKHPNLSSVIYRLEDLEHILLKFKQNNEKIVIVGLGAGSIGKKMRDAVSIVFKN